MKVKTKKFIEKREIIKLVVSCTCGYTYIIEFLDEELAELEKSFLLEAGSCMLCQEENRIGISALKFR